MLKLLNREYISRREIYIHPSLFALAHVIQSRERRTMSVVSFIVLRQAVTDYGGYHTECNKIIN